MKGYWIHSKKFKNKRFFGNYKIFENERVFNLHEIDGKRVITHESWQMAKKLGWIKIHK